MATLSTSIPSPSAPMVDPQSGIISSQWWFVFQRLIARTGGEAGTGFMPLTGGTFTGPVKMNANELSGSDLVFTGGSLDGIPIGATTPANGSFVNLSATGTVSGAGVVSLLAPYATIAYVQNAFTGGGTSGSFTDLSSSGTVSGAGFVAWAASPPAIGTTAPAAGAFTSLSATSTVSGAGFTAWAASPPAIGGTAPAAAAFTTLSATSTVSGAGFTAWAASPPSIGSTVAASGAFTALSSSGTFTPAQVAGIVGTTTNNNAQAGSVGEVISSVIVGASAVSLVTGTAKTVTSISLTAGDWDVCGEVWVSVGTGGATGAHGAINTATNALPTDSALATARSQVVAALTASLTQIVSLRPCRVSLSGTTSYFLVAQAEFPSGTTSAYGNIIARRVR